MNRPPPLKGKVYECFSLYGRFVNRPYNLFKHPDKPKFKCKFLPENRKNPAEFRRGFHIRYVADQTLLERTSSSYFSISEYQVLQGQTLLRTQNSAQTSPRGMSLYSSWSANSLE